MNIVLAVSSKTSEGTKGEENNSAYRCQVKISTGSDAYRGA